MIVVRAETKTRVTANVLITSADRSALSLSRLAPVQLRGEHEHSCRFVR